MLTLRKALHILFPFMARPCGRLGMYMGLDHHGFALVNPSGTDWVYPLPAEETEILAASCTIGDLVVLTERGDLFFRYGLRNCCMQTGRKSV